MTLAAVALLAMPHGVADERWIIEPGPEAANAQKLGASEVARAQKLAKTKQYEEAAAVLEAVSRKHPAAVHDCNLALAYLRAGALTRAQLVWDLSRLRNGTRPKWCTGDVSTQLSVALREKGFVPTTIDVVPADAVIEVDGVAMRGMRTVWLPPGTATISASAPGKQSQSVTASVAAPSTRVAITLEAPPPPVVEPDAGVTIPAAPVDAAPVVVARADAAPIEQPPSALITIGGKPVGYRYVALTVAVVGWLGAGVGGLLTLKARDDANAVYTTDPAFAELQMDYDELRWTTVGSLAVGAIATAVTVYLFTRDDAVNPQPGNVQVGFGEDSLGISYSGTFGGGAR